MPICYTADSCPSRKRIVDLDPVADVSWTPRAGQRLMIKVEIEYYMTMALPLPAAFIRPKIDRRKKRNSDSKAQRRN